MGTRFIPTDESQADPAYKQMIVDCNAEDLMVTASITGTAASWLKPSMRNAGLDPDQMPDTPTRSYDSNQSFAGKRWMDVWAAGQGLGAIKQIEPVAQVVDRLVVEYQQAAKRFAALAR